MSTAIEPGRGGAPRPLERCDPSVLLGVVVAVPLVLVRAHHAPPLVALWMGAVVGVLATTRVGVRRLALAQLPFVWFGVSLLLVNAVTRDGVVLATPGPFEVTDDGLRMGTALAARTMLVGVCATGLLTAVDPARLLTSLHLVARLPVRPTYALLAAYRLLDDLPAEWLAVRRAHAVRLPVQPGRRRRLPRTPAALGRAAFVLLVTSLRRAERVAIALESRGLGAPDTAARTTWRTAHVTWRDGVLVVVVGAALVIAFAWAG